MNSTWKHNNSSFANQSGKSDGEEDGAIGQVAYVTFVCLMLIMIVFSNTLVVVIILKFKLLQHVTNRYISTGKRNTASPVLNKI